MPDKNKSLPALTVLAIALSLFATGCSSEAPSQEEHQVSSPVASSVAQPDLVSLETIEINNASLRMTEKRKAAEKAATAQAELDRIAAETKATAEAEALKVSKAQAKQEKKVAPAPGSDPYRWIQDAQNLYGVYADPDTTFIVSDAGNCGGPGGGCTDQWSTFTGPITTHISPSGIGDYQLLFHEIAHTRGVINECAADRWAHNVTGVVIWKYRGCAG